MPVVLHAADLHLDSPFAGLSPERAAQRRGEQRDLLARLAALVAEQGVELVLLSGDLLDSRDYYADTAAALCRALAQMAVPVLIAPGNHDLAPLYAGLELPENVTIFDRDAITSVPLPALNCTVHGRGLCSPSPTPFAELGFRAPDDGQTHLLCLHGEVGGQTLRFGPIDPADLAASGVTYAALGHVHTFSGLQRAGNTVWAYPGCPEGRGFDETGDKGVLIGTVEPGRVELRFHPLCRRRYHVVTADLTGCPDPVTAALNALPDRAEADICRVVLTGESPGVDLPAVTAAVGAQCYSATVLDHTTVPRDLLRRAGEDTLTGFFLREMNEHAQQPGYDLALRFGLAALEHGEEPCP